MGHDLYRQDLYQMLIDLIRGNPRASEKETLDELWDQVKSNSQIYRLLIDNWFIRNYSNLRDRIEVKEDGSTVYKTPRKSFYRPASASTERAVKIIRNLVIMDLLMPNGKQLRDCTFADLANLGNWARDLCKHGKPTEVVGKKLTEDQVRDVWARHALKGQMVA